MRALCRHGRNDVGCGTIPAPIIEVTSCAIRGSDLHPMDGRMPTMTSDDVLGHEFMREVVETGGGQAEFAKGDRIVVPFNIDCRAGRQCRSGDGSVCERSNRDGHMAAEQFGYPTAGLFGHSHPTGGYGPERGRDCDEAMTFRSAHSLSVHRPLGSVMRARLEVYAAPSAFRHRETGAAEVEPNSIADVPA